MTVVQQGAINITALTVPDLYVQIVPPQENFLNGVPSNVLGIVGVGSWGPVNAPQTISGYASAIATFGPVGNRKYDLATAIWAATLNGANAIQAVRVSDGTDTAASATIGTNGLTVTGRYTGVLGNQVQFTLATGARSGTWKAVIGLPGIVPEVFDNIGLGLTGNALWAAIAAAINSGAGPLRGPSQIIVASTGASVAAPVAGTTALAGGTDGTGAVVGSTLIGVDGAGSTRRGMYALRGTGAAVAFLADCDDPTTYTAQVAYGLSEGTYMIATGPAGDTIVNAATTKASVGVDSYAAKLMFGDWCQFRDNVNGVIRLISPQGFVAGRLSALAPQESALNKPLYGILGTQRSTTGTPYSGAELQQLAQAGIDVIANPAPGGAYFGSRLGLNSASNAAVNGDNYTRLTNYIAYTLNAGMGKFVGRLQNLTVRAQAVATTSAFLSTMQQARQIGNVNSPTAPAYSVKCDATNNPASQVALGYMQIDVRVTYLGVITKLLVNVEGGQTVNVTIIPVTTA